MQEKRSQAAYIIDTLNVLTPDNTYLTALEAENPTTYKVTGRAISDNKIAVFMRALPSTGVFSQPELLSIKKVENYLKDYSDFPDMLKLLGKVYFQNGELNSPALLTRYNPL